MRVHLAEKGDGAELIWDKVCVENVWQFLVYQMCVLVLELYQNLVMLGYCFILPDFEDIVLMFSPLITTLNYEFSIYLLIKISF